VTTKHLLLLYKRNAVNILFVLDGGVLVLPVMVSIQNRELSIMDATTSAHGVSILADYLGIIQVLLGNSKHTAILELLRERNDVKSKKPISPLVPEVGRILSEWPDCRP
jgi:hypothetical protein